MALISLTPRVIGGVCKASLRPFLLYFCFYFYVAIREVGVNGKGIGGVIFIMHLGRLRDTEIILAGGGQELIISFYE